MIALIHQRVLKSRKGRCCNGAKALVTGCRGKDVLKVERIWTTLRARAWNSFYDGGIGFEGLAEPIPVGEISDDSIVVMEWGIPRIGRLQRSLLAENEVIGVALSLDLACCSKSPKADALRSTLWMGVRFSRASWTMGLSFRNSLHWLTACAVIWYVLRLLLC